MDRGYEYECISPHCGSVFWSEYTLERCPNCGGTSLKKEVDRDWELASTEHL